MGVRNIKIERHPVRSCYKCLEGPHNTYDRSTNSSRMHHTKLDPNRNEGTGTRPDYLANRGDQKNQGPLGKKWHAIREIAGE